MLTTMQLDSGAVISIKTESLPGISFEHVQVLVVDKDGRLAQVECAGRINQPKGSRP